MSDAEQRRLLTDLHVTATQTARDVQWIKEAMTTDAAAVKGRLDDHEKRLRLAERIEWVRCGFAAAIGAVFGIGGGSVLKP